MMGMAFVAAIVNLICLVLLRRDTSDDVNMEAAETFSLNDFASNGGILVAGALIMWLNQAWPDAHSFSKTPPFTSGGTTCA